MRFELAVGVLLAAAACGMGTEGDGMDPGQQKAPVTGPTRNFAHVSQTLLAGCSFSTCHSPRGMLASGGLDLMTDTWLAVVNVNAHNARAATEGLKLVSPCDPEHSLLFIKLSLGADVVDPNTDYGGHMPAANAPLSADEIAVIHDWIARGALLAEPDDAPGTDCKY